MERTESGQGVSVERRFENVTQRPVVNVMPGTRFFGDFSTSLRGATSSEAIAGTDWEYGCVLPTQSCSV